MKLCFIILFIKTISAFSPSILRLSMNSKDLLVVGASVTGIGTRVMKLQRDAHPLIPIVGETKTIKNHDFILKLNCTPRLSSEDYNETFSNVVITAPPYFDEINIYNGTLTKAISKWNKKGKLIFAGSGRHYIESNGNYVTEKSEVNKDHYMYQYESIIKEAGGTCLRFGALYGFNRGDFWNLLDKTNINVNPNMRMEMCNYDDATSAIMTILNTNESVSKEVYNVCDGKGKTIQEILNNCVRVYEYKDKTIPIFINNTTYLGKRYNITKIKNLGWRPRWNSFEEWCRAHSYAANPVSNEIKLYQERKILKKEELERLYDIKLENDNNIVREGLLNLFQLLAFFIVEIYLVNLPKK